MMKTSLSRAIPKPQKIQQDEERLNFVRNMPCLANFPFTEGPIAVWSKHLQVCTSPVAPEMYQRSESHHIRKGSHSGLGRKPPAYRTVPLCTAAHSEYHALGHDTFCAKYELNLEEHLARINAEYDALHPKKVTKPARKRKQKATLHILNCAGCSHAHEIPPGKLIQERGILKFWCIHSNQVLEV